MIFNQEKEFKTAEELVDLFTKDMLFRTRRIWDVSTGGRGGHIYRGQSNAEWKLVPSVFRTCDALSNYTPQSPGTYNPEQQNIWLGLHLHAELRSVFIFLEVADKLGIETPIDYTRVKDHVGLINSALNDKECDYAEVFPNNTALEELALAQHHGVPTRLLDWTESPLVACFFAALNASSIVPENERIDSEYIAVVCFLVSRFSKSDAILKVSAPRHRNNFLRLQEGVFTHIPKANAYFIENEEWPSVEDIVSKNIELSGALKKYYIPTKEADNMLRILFDYGITVHHMMPTLDNIAKSQAYASKLFKA